MTESFEESNSEHLQKQEEMNVAIQWYNSRYNLYGYNTPQQKTIYSIKTIVSIADDDTISLCPLRQKRFAKTHSQSGEPVLIETLCKSNARVCVSGYLNFQGDI